MEKFTTDAIVKSVIRITQETFDTMMSMAVEQTDKVTDPDLGDERMVGAVCFGGEVIGVMSLHVSQAFSRMITAAMLGMGVEEIKDEEEIKDVVGELSNIVSGNLKTDFMDAGLNCVISTPSITRGDDFKIEPSQVAGIQEFVFRHDTHDLLIQLSVKEEIGSTEGLSRTEELSSEAIQEKINSVDISNAVVNSVIDVFYTMLSMEITKIEEVPEGFVEDLRTVGTVTFAGDVDGLFNIQVNDDFARTMTAAMLGMEEADIESEEEVFDVIRELSNIIGGNLKSNFVDAGLATVLSTPSITNGRNFRVEALNIISTQKFLFQCQGHTIIVEAGIKKEGAAAASPAADVETEDAPEKADAIQPEKEPEERPPDPYQNLDLILDIPLEMTVELGRTKKRINDLLKIGPGTVVELAQLDGEPVDILVKNTLVAKGQVVVEKEKYGIRIVEVVSRKERLNSLK